MPEVENSRVKFSGRIVEVAVERIRHGGQRAVREVVRVGDVCAVLPVRESDRETEVLLVKQYRHPAGRQLWEIPAGRLDHCETALACARRELLEETGYHAEKWSRLGGFHTSPGFATEYLELYLAENLRKAEDPPQGDEIAITAAWKSIRQLREGSCVDGKTLAALTLFGWHENIT